MTSGALAYSPIFFLIKEHLEEVNLPLRMKLHGLIIELTDLLKRQPSELRPSMDLLISQLFDIRIQAMKWLSRNDEDIDFNNLYEDIQEDISPFISDKKYGLLAENCLFALRSNFRVLSSVTSQISTVELENGIQGISEADITYDQLKALLRASIPLSHEFNILINWINSSLRVEFVIFSFAIIQDSKLNIQKDMVEELSTIVVNESHEYYSLSKTLGLIQKKTVLNDNNIISPEFINEQETFSELGLDEFFKTLDS
ncbi:MAG: hypothetical protein RIC35_00890 [Marinoscillum sp.]